MMDFDTILQRIADAYGTCPEEVYREMQEAIDAGFRCPDPAVQAAWAKIRYSGDRPTPEDVICGIARKLKSLDKSE